MEITARRHCLVCDWEGAVVEPADALEIGGECPECRAPTERTGREKRKRSAPNPHAAALGRLGGLKGGPARAAALTAARRKELARRAALARWRRRH